METKQRLMRSNSWSSEDEVQLRALAEEGLTADEVASKMRRTRGSVLGFIHRNKIVLARRDHRVPMKDVKQSTHVKEPVVKRETGSVVVNPAKREGNNRWNYRRAEEMLKAPQTVGDWPKPENEESVLIADVKSYHCQMPLWDFIGPQSKYCGRPRLRFREITVSPYCAGCHKLAYQPPR